MTTPEPIKLQLLYTNTLIVFTTLTIITETDISFHKQNWTRIFNVFFAQIYLNITRFIQNSTWIFISCHYDITFFNFLLLWRHFSLIDDFFDVTFLWQLFSISIDLVTYIKTWLHPHPPYSNCYIPTCNFTTSFNFLSNVSTLFSYN